MNWLTHLVLSADSPAFRLGNLLPDIVASRHLSELPEPILRGVRCHIAIDRYTDAHPVVRRAIRRFPPPHRRFAPIIVDIVFDHFLTVAWHDHMSPPLDAFVDDVFASFEAVETIPADALPHLRRMRESRLLCSYGTLDGLRTALQRTGRRLRRPIDLGAAMDPVRENYEEFAGDFAEFFPDLRQAVAPLIE